MHSVQYFLYNAVCVQCLFQDFAQTPSAKIQRGQVQIQGGGGGGATLYQRGGKPIPRESKSIPRGGESTPWAP